MNADRVIVDANIAFKCLVAGRGDLRERIGPGGHPQLFTLRFLLVELFKHKERLIRASGLPEDDLLAGLHTLYCPSFTKPIFRLEPGSKLFDFVKRLTPTTRRTSRSHCIWKAAFGLRTRR